MHLKNRLTEAEDGSEFERFIMFIHFRKTDLTLRTAFFSFCVNLCSSLTYRQSPCFSQSAPYYGLLAHQDQRKHLFTKNEVKSNVELTDQLLQWLETIQLSPNYPYFYILVFWVQPTFNPNLVASLCIFTTHPQGLYPPQPPRAEGTALGFWQLGSHPQLCINKGVFGDFKRWSIM